MKRESGFSLMELLIVMVIIGFVLAASTEMIVSMLRGYKQQGKVAETNIEGIIGLELLRRDLESAGYGLPWTIPNTTYSEVDAGNAIAFIYNDATANPPRAFLAGNDINTGDYMPHADYLVVKAQNVAKNEACTKWNYMFGGAAPISWSPARENLKSTDRVIVISPGSPEMSSRVLISPTGSMASGVAPLYSDVALLSVADDSRLIYGVDDSNIRRPFNRADYYVKKPAASDLPRRCAPGTGILYKAVLNQGNENLGFPMPLLDCVADMQVVTRLDTSVPPDGTPDSDSPGFLAGTAQDVRDQLKEIRVYILAHEGQRDTSYSHGTNPILVGPDATLGRSADLSAVTTNWQNYRWKVYTIVVKPNNLR